MSQVVYQSPMLMDMEIKSANNKRIYLNGFVDDDMALKVSYFANKILEMDKLKPSVNKEVTFLINSYGGSIISGNSIIGNIKRLQKAGYKVIGICESCAFSMAYDILVHCDIKKGYELSQYLLHQSSYGLSGELKEMIREADFQKKVWEMSVNYYIANTNLTRERIEEIYEKKENYFFTAQEALKNGSIDEII